MVPLLLGCKKKVLSPSNQVVIISSRDMTKKQNGLGKWTHTKNVLLIQHKKNEVQELF